MLNYLVAVSLDYYNLFASTSP